MTAIHFDRETYFDAVRKPLFGGSMTEGQVIGQEAILLQWETNPLSDDLRHLAYASQPPNMKPQTKCCPSRNTARARACHMASRCRPGSGNVFYGRGYVQLTWRRQLCEGHR